jgi:fatty-acyl-CoA synthase
VPDADWGEIITAFVVLRPDQSLDLSELRRYCETSLAAHKHPRRLVILDAFPRTGPTGQVQRRRLVEFASSRPAASEPDR